jgi:hypothetical protein
MKYSKSKGLSSLFNLIIEFIEMKSQIEKASDSAATTANPDDENQQESDQESEENFGEFNPNLKSRLLYNEREFF